jgi:phosphate transport system permease protein
VTIAVHAGEDCLPMTAAATTSDDEVPFVPNPPPTGKDRWFARLTAGAGVTTLVLLILVGVFLLNRAWPALHTAGWSFLSTVDWQMQLHPPRFGVAGLLYGTVVVAVIALVLAVPVSILSALFISEWTPPRWRGTVVSLVDLLAAVPSLLYGMWGFLYLEPRLTPLSAWLAHHLSWIPLFTVHNGQYARSYFTAGVVVSLMVLPIATSVSREAFSQTPPAEKEAALALGGSRWGMVRTVVLPYGRGGVVGGCMLGFGRALGETIAVTLMLAQIPKVSGHVLESGGATISGYIVHNFGGTDIKISALLGCGLVLFAFTLLTNSLAAVIVSRSRSGQGVD